MACLVNTMPPMRILFSVGCPFCDEMGKNFIEDLRTRVSDAGRVGRNCIQECGEVIRVEGAEVIRFLGQPVGLNRTYLLPSYYCLSYLP